VAQEKKIQIHTFEGAINTDGADAGPADLAIQPNQARFFINCRIYGIGTKGKAITVPGNLQIPFLLPVGQNQAIGWANKEDQNTFYWINWNSNGYHGIYCYNDTNQTVTPVLLNITQTNGVDIMQLTQTNLINHFEVINDSGNDLGYWVDGNVKARKTNLTTCMNGGYGAEVLEEFITAYKPTGLYPPVPVYGTDINTSANYLYAQQYKFCYRFYYADGEISNTSDFSIVPKPPGESYNGADNITYNNNFITVPVPTGSGDVTQIEILVQILTTAENTGFLLPWQSAIILNKLNSEIADNTTFNWSFYNNLPLTAVDQSKVNRPYSYLPDVPKCQSFVQKAMTYANFPEGKPTVTIDASVVVTSQNLFLPSDTVPQLNKPAFIITTLSITKKDGLFGLGGYWYITNTSFEVGFDVKKGNTFVLIGTNGSQDNYYYPVTAGYGDTAETIAAQIKAFLRSIGRGVPDGPNGISNESTDGSGNVSWDFSYLGQWNANATRWSGSVNPVNYSTLGQDGTSVNVIKSGGSKKYAIVLQDSDGRKFGAYTDDGLLAVTPFLTQWGTDILQQPIHTISIFSVPPPWAVAWYLVRTSDITGEIQMLIQQVNNITVAGEGTFLDLIIGSVYTYQLIHPDTIVQYQFQRGDRVRLIKNEISGDLYPYYDTEVLSYIQTELQTINSQIVCNGTDLVAPSDGPKTDYVGKNIIINGAERTIVNIVTVSGTGYYTVNEPINPNTANFTVPTTTATYASYQIIDRRGIIRINEPPSSITLAAFSLVEVYHPQANAANEQSNAQYQNFQECGLKFPILNPGTPQAAYVGNVNNNSGTPNQDPTDPADYPAIVQVTDGEAYFRFRFLPTNVPFDPTDPSDVQGIIDTVEDSNFSDFYWSNLYNLGRIYPQDQGAGMQLFDQRVRFSNNFIQDTKTNGLNDFDNTDRKDYNDQYGAINLTKYRKGVLLMYKALHTTWTQVLMRRIVSNSGEVGLATSDALLNDLEYSELEVGIGDNGESWFESDGHYYFGSTNSGIFVRQAQDGSIPISEIYNFDQGARAFLSEVAKYNLPMPGGFDRTNKDAIWSCPAYIQYLFNSGFLPSQWQTAIAPYPIGTTWVVSQQPSNSTATVSGQQINITGTNTLGDDYFLYYGNIPGGGTTPIMKFCFTVVAPPPQPTGWTQQTNTAYCLQSGGQNTGMQGWTVLNQIYLGSGSLTGLNMPNIQNISPQAIVPNTNNITYNANSSPAPSGGSNGDVWYNAPVDVLYAKIAGTWTILTNRFANQYYIAPIQNLTSCPLPAPTAYFSVYSQYNVNISGVNNGTTTGTPAALNTLAMTNGQTVNAVYTTTGGSGTTVVVTYSGTPAIPGHTYFQLIVNGVVEDTQLVTGGSVTLTYTTSATSPTPVAIDVITM